MLLDVNVNAVNLTLKGIDNEAQNYQLMLSNSRVAIAPVLHRKSDVYYSVE